MDVTDRLEAAAQHCQDPGLLHEAAATIRSLRRWLREVEDAARRAEQASAIRAAPEDKA